MLTTNAGGMLNESWRVNFVEAAESLPFSLSKLPPTVNNDMLIKICLDAAGTDPPVCMPKLRRLMRAPPAPETIAAVQVDAATRSLFVDGKQWSGNGWYLGAFGNGYSPGSLNQLREALPEIVQSGINLAMVGSLNSLYFNWSSPCWPPSPGCKSYQERFLDAAADAGLKVIYPGERSSIAQPTS